MAATDSNVNLELPLDFVGQLLEGLSVLTEQWDDTATYLEHGQVWDEPRILRDCNDASEAKAISAYYRRIAEDIQQQLSASSA